MAGASLAQVIRFMLDADIAIYAMLGDHRVNAAITGVGSDHVAVSTLVHSQLLQGVPGRPNPELELVLIDTLLLSMAVIPYDIAASTAYGRITAALGFSRRDAFDRMIAAHAVSLGATLVTNNVKDFAAIPGLPVVNWAEA